MPQHNTFNPIQNLATQIGAATPTKPAVIIDCTYDGTSYKITYSDGWVELGGYRATPSIGSYGAAEVTFGDTSPFTNGVVASVKCTPVNTGNTTGATAMFSDYAVESITSSGFTYRKCSSSSALTGFYWTAKGY